MRRTGRLHFNHNGVGQPGSCSKYVWAAGSLSAAALIFFEVVNWVFFPKKLVRGLYFESNSSEDMMQTLSLKVLVESPREALFYLHYQPPGFDIVRLVLAIPELIAGVSPSVRSVDIRLYLFYALLYGCLNGIIFYWSHYLTRSLVVATLTTLAWAMYPGNLFMATYLDSMYLSAFLFAVIFHFWFLSISVKRLKWVLGAGVSLLLFSLVRTSFQPVLMPLLILLAVAVLIRYVPRDSRKRLLGAAIILSAIALALPLKQVLLFGTPSTSTTSGHHLLGMIRYSPSQSEKASIEVPRRIEYNGHRFENKYNNFQELATNYRYSKVFFKTFFTDPTRALSNSLVTARRSIIRGASATHTYQPNALVDQLPWSRICESLFSGLSYAVLVFIGLTFLVVFIRPNKSPNWSNVLVKNLPPVFLFAMVAAVVVFGSMRYTTSAAMGEPFGWTDGFTWTESNRLKFLLEVVLLPPAFLGIFRSNQVLAHFCTRNIGKEFN